MPDLGSRGAMGVGGGLGRRPPPACVGGRTSPAVAGGHLGGYDVGSESGVLSGEESCYTLRLEKRSRFEHFMPC